MLAAVGLNHRTATVAQRELLAARASDSEADLGALVALGGIDEVAVVSNCWRVEVYAATRCPAAAVLALREALTARAGDLPLFAFHGKDAFRHLARVASGVESPLLGEAQVLSEVTTAFERAMDSGAAGIELTSTLERVLQIARRVRDDVPAKRPCVSWGHAVAALAEQVLGPEAGRRVAVVGAGEKARLLAAHLRANGAKLVVLDRALANAEALARELSAEARPLDALDDEIVRADVVVSAGRAAAGAFRSEPMARLAATRGRRMVLVDATVPRGVSTQLGAIPDVYLCDVDDLERVARAIVCDGSAERARAERVVEQEVGRWACGDAVPTASTMEISH